MPINFKRGKDKPEVYFMDDRSAESRTSLTVKAQQLFDKARLHECFDKGDRVALKVHMGEWGNTAYLRPILVKTIVERVKKYGGKPFVADTTTLPYAMIGSRVTEEDYTVTATANGFTEETLGCPISIADGPMGFNDVRVDFPEGILLEETYIAEGIAEADAMIAISHFKGHVWGVYGGAIKNLGVGCVSKRGKLILHLASHPKVGLKTWSFDGSKCKGRDGCELWGLCQNACPVGAIRINGDGMDWDPEKCIGCFAHIPYAFSCKVWEIPDEWFNYSVIAIADSASAVLKSMGPDKVGFITYAVDMTPLCDCAPFSDRPVMPNIGVLASRDMVAIDTAALDLTMLQRGIPGSRSEEMGVMEPGTEKFTTVSSSKNIRQWVQVNVCEALGAGSKDYELMVEPTERDWWNYVFPKYNLGNPPGLVWQRYYKVASPIPREGFRWKSEPRIKIDDLSSR